MTQRMNKHSIGYGVLQVLSDLGEVTLNTFFSRKYSYARLSRSLWGLDRSRKISRKTISTILWRLRREGLISRTGGSKNAVWQLTPTGKAQLKQAAHDPKTDIISDGITRLVIFDIPERERKKRTIVRTELIACNFQQLQKSVWIGDCPLPEGFVRSLDAMGLAEYVHIFSVREKGTISH